MYCKNTLKMFDVLHPTDLKYSSTDLCLLPLVEPNKDFVSLDTKSKLESTILFYCTLIFC